MTFTVEGDVATFQPEEFILALSQQLAINPKSIQVISYRAGSVLVDTRMSQAAYDALSVVDDRLLAKAGVLTFQTGEVGFRVCALRP